MLTLTFTRVHSPLRGLLWSEGALVSVVIHQKRGSKVSRQVKPDRPGLLGTYPLCFELFTAAVSQNVKHLSPPFGFLSFSRIKLRTAAKQKDAFYHQKQFESGEKWKAIFIDQKFTFVSQMQIKSRENKACVFFVLNNRRCNITANIFNMVWLHLKFCQIQTFQSKMLKPLICFSLSLY